MFKKIKLLIREHKKIQSLSYLQLLELEWANVYHDSIRGKKPIEELSLNVGRWAGNYAFFYLLHRVLEEYKPKKIIEFGLGESSKFISTYIDHYLKDTSLLTIEDNISWKQSFESKFKCSNQSEIKILENTFREYNGQSYRSYKNIEYEVNDFFDLYIVDGPIGSQHYSRFDIVSITDKFNSDSEFVIIIDDYDRQGEKETASVLIDVFKNKNIEIYTKEYIGNKSVLVIATKAYKYIRSF